MRAYWCKWCRRNSLEKRFWEKKRKGGLIKKGKYYYYVCVICGYRNTVKEIENEEANLS